MGISLLDLIDPDRIRSKFNSAERHLADKLERVWKTQGLPQGFSPEGAHIRRDSHSTKPFVYVRNKSSQMCMLNKDRLEIYYQCPECHNEGFKGSLPHSPKCNNYDEKLS